MLRPPALDRAGVRDRAGIAAWERVTRTREAVTGSAMERQPSHSGLRADARGQTISEIDTDQLNEDGVARVREG